MKKLIPLLILASVALAPIAKAQDSDHQSMPGMHSQEKGMAMHTRIWE